MKHAAGTILICRETGRFLLALRGDGGSHKRTWATIGGGIDYLEKPLQAAQRELYEETKIPSDEIEYKFFERQHLNGTDYYLFLGFCDEEYECELNGENLDWGWFDMGTLPEPLIPTLFSSLVRIF
jgi:8-oxo-dGTP pyrophosphatase MutT (NUDIX family)